MADGSGGTLSLGFASVLIVEDHPLYSDALMAALKIVSPDCEVKTAHSLGEAFEDLAGGFQPDLVMFDLKLPDVSGISGFINLRERVAGVPILVISSLASVELVQSLLREGAAGFLPKDSSAQKLRSVLKGIANGQRYIPQEYKKQPLCESDVHPRLAALTPQQQKIFKLICAGKPNKQIAYELSLAEATVKAHITALLRRLEVTNRTQAAVLVEAALAEDSGENPEATAFLRN